MTIARIAVLVVLSSVCLPMIGQEQAEAPRPATQLEAFQSKTGNLVIRGYTNVGRVIAGGRVTVFAHEFRDAANLGVLTTGISIHILEPSRIEKEASAFIDFDEIPGLLAAIDYLLKVSPSVTRLKDFEVEYRTKGDFRVAAINERPSGISAVASAGRVARAKASLSLKDLQEVRALIVAAKEQLGN